MAFDPPGLTGPMNSAHVFGFVAAAPVHVTHPDRAAFLGDLAGRMAARQGFHVATVNLDHIVKLRADPAFAAAYAAHSHVVADGNSIVWLSRLAGRHVDRKHPIDPVCRLTA